ncbi:MAG: glycerate kinase [Chloroflexi bacterium]|nr:glycerate kinase [Chloroflexota bacterium]
MSPDEIEQKRRRSLALSLVRAALDAVEPGVAVRRHLVVAGDRLEVNGRTYDLRRYRRILIVGGGKAAAPMAQAVEAVLGDRLTAGIVNVKYGYVAPTRLIEINQAGHPIPDERGVAGARRMVELVQSATADDLVICLISGGGSALMALPAPGISLADKRRLTDGLLRSGATINELNTVRKHLSAIKGGQLARIARPADVITLVLSDVVGCPLDVIASGPTVPDTTTFQDAWRVIEQHGLAEDLPPSIARQLQAGLAGELPDTPKPGDPTFDRCCNVVVASNEIAARAVREYARTQRFNAMVLSTFVEGEAREVAAVYAAIAREIAHSGQPLARPACVIAGGETVVTVRGHGLGGRNQELALAAALRLDGILPAMVIALGTDGTDGPTDAAGAMADGYTMERARALGLDAPKFLADNDSYHFFQQLGDLIVTGPTNTNVNDLTFILVFPERG